MRLVEAVAGKLLHQVKDALGFFLGDPVGSASGHELGALRGHLFLLLLSHGAAKDVRFSKRKTRQEIGDLHHLFLVQDDAVGFLKNVFQLRKFEADLGLALFAVDEIVDHAALDGAGTVQRVESGEIFDARGLVATENVAHAV